MLPTDHELMMVIRRISRMKDWDGAVQSTHSAALWRYTPLMDAIRATTRRFVRWNDQTGPQHDELVRIAQGWLIGLIQGGRCKSVRDLMRCAYRPLMDELKKATDDRALECNGYLQSAGRKFQRLLRRAGLAERASDDEIAETTGERVERVSDLRRIWTFMRPITGICPSLVRRTDGTVTLVRSKDRGRRWRADDGHLWGEGSPDGSNE